MNGTYVSPCKEGRPLPIVQMGLFVDRDGFPLAMCIEPGNKAETSTLKPMEEILKDKFGLPKLVVCTDGGLSSYDNRKNDSIWTLHQCQRVRRWSSASS